MIPSVVLALVLSASASDPGELGGSSGSSDLPTGEVPGGVDRPDVTAGIINGEPAGKDDWPMALGLMVDVDVDVNGGFGSVEVEDTALICTATLIAPDVVLTAAHCTDLQGLFDSMGYAGILAVRSVSYGFSEEPDLEGYPLDLLGGGWPDDIDVDGDGAADQNTGATSVRPTQFDLATMQIGLADNHDIALVFLDEPVDLPYAYLPTTEEAAQIVEGAPVSIVGWGQTTSDLMPPAGTVGHKVMADTVIGEVSDYEIQIGVDASDGRKCHGDSGGPTFMEVQTPSPVKTRVIGVTSHSYDFTDCLTRGGVDTRVDYHLDWIDKQMRDACADGTRSWCDEPGILPPPSPSAGEALSALFPVVAAGSEERGGCSTTGGLPAGWGVALAFAAALRRRAAR